jgi:hypothetical protein
MIVDYFFLELRAHTKITGTKLKNETKIMIVDYFFLELRAHTKITSTEL